MILLNVFFSLKPEHKIQSADGPLQLHLVQAPKMMVPLVKEWIPQAFTVSFKVRQILIVFLIQCLSSSLHYPEKTADILPCHHQFPHKMTSEK